MLFYLVLLYTCLAVPAEDKSVVYIYADFSAIAPFIAYKI